MLMDRPKEEIARDLLVRAADVWGEERAKALRAQVEETAEWLSLIGKHSLALGDEEPDFLVAPAIPREEGG